jgi:hypothetical protein
MGSRSNKKGVVKEKEREAAESNTTAVKHR